MNSTTSFSFKHFSLFIVTLISPVISIAQNVFIPDSIFKAALIGNVNINTNGDAEIQLTEAAVYNGWIEVPQLNINDLTGIEVFTHIPYLDCKNNNLNSLNVNANTALTRLYCSGNNLTSLDVSNNTALTDLLCEFNALTALNISANTALVKLSCYNNLISNLDVSTNSVLEQLYCGHNLLTALDLAANPALTALSFSENQFTAIDLSNNPALIYFYCAANLITQLDLSSHNELVVVDCGFNLLSTLDITGDTSLAYLFCSGNQLTTLNVSALSHLAFLTCDENQISSLDLSANPMLTTMNANDNQLTSLNIQNGTNTSITSYTSHNNPMLFCIQVDDASYSSVNWGFVDPWSSFSNNCFTSLEETAVSISSHYPNPFINQFLISVPPDYLGSHLSIHDSSGKIRMQTVAEKNILTVNTENFPAGLYLLHIINSRNEITCHKIMKE